MSDDVTVAYFSRSSDNTWHYSGPITSYEPRWYGRLLLRLADRLHNLAYVGAREVVSDADLTVVGGNHDSGQWTYTRSGNTPLT